MGEYSRSVPAARSRFFVIGILISVFICLNPPCGITQTEIKIVGRVIDIATGSPIPGVAVAIQGSARYAVSDAVGQFRFTDLPVGRYSLSAHRIGYAASNPANVDVVASGPAGIVISLSALPVGVSGQIVTAERIDAPRIINNGDKTIVEIPGNGLTSFRSVVERLPALELIESGPRQYLRLRGSQANALVILLDGRVQNSSLASYADISTIPLQSVRRIEFSRGGGGTSGGLAGSVNFVTQLGAEDNDFSSAAERGSFGHEMYSTKLSARYEKRYDLGLDLSHLYYRGDFDFTDPRDSLQTRQNNFSQDTKAFGQLAAALPGADLSLKARYFHRHAGIPGPIFQLTPNARSLDSEKEIYVNAGSRLAGNIGFSATSGLTYRSMEYDSPQTPQNPIPYHTRFDEDSRDLKVQVQKAGKRELDVSMALRHNMLNGFDLIRPASSFGRHSRMTSDISAGARIPLISIEKIIDETFLNAGIRREDGSGGEFWAPSATLRLNLSLPLRPGLDLSYNRSRRLPDLTDLYWKEDVFATPNPDLKPENSSGYEAGVDFETGKREDFNLRAARFENSYSNLIVWRKWGGDKFKPVNIAKALICGWEFSGDWRPFSGPVVFGWASSYLKPQNRETNTVQFDKYLTFRPLESRNARIEFRHRQLAVKLSGRHIGRRYTTEENTKSLPPVDVLYIQFGFSHRLRSFRAKWDFEISNIENKQYELLERQPEKPRQYLIKLEIVHIGGTS